MKKLRCLIVVVCVSLLAIPAAVASADQHLETQGGVKVTVIYDPFGPNNLIAASIRFVNTNEYKVHVSWQPTITCEGSDLTKGQGEPFVISEGGSYQVTIWRSQTCGNRKLADIKVEIFEVKKATDD